MKRVGYIYEKICSVENLQKALDKASKGKKNKPYVRRILQNRDKLIQRLHEQLMRGEFTPGRNRHKTIIEQPCGKARDITVPKFFPDHVIHWAVCLQLQPIFMRGMYRYCIGSVPGRGGHDGKKQIEKMLRENKMRYILKLDIRKFFQSIDHEKLKELFRRKIKDRKALWLIDTIIDAGGDGLPIGYYTSQWFSNFYLEQLDHFIKEELKIKFEVRYVDDIVLADTNKRKLHKARLQIAEFLRVNGFRVNIKGNWQLWKIHTRPLDFLGFRFYKNKTLLRKRIFYRFMRRVRRVKKKGYCTVQTARGISAGLGWLKHIPGGRHFYLNSVKPIISKKELRKIVSAADKRKRSETNMIIKDRTDLQTENYKEQLGLKGDVYVVGQNYIESLESHKQLIPDSKATTIEEAEQERLAYIRAEEERLAALAAQSEEATEEDDDAGGDE